MEERRLGGRYGRRGGGGLKGERKAEREMEEGGTNRQLLLS